MIDHRSLKIGVAFRPPAKTVCAECPLSRACAPGALGGYTAQQYLEVLFGPADLACHMSKGFNDDGRQTQRSCTGVAVFRANTEVRGLARNAQAAVEAVQPDRGMVFGSAYEFANHHDPALAMRIRLAMLLA